MDAIADSKLQQLVRLSSPKCMREAVARPMEVEAARGAAIAIRQVSASVGFRPVISSACSAARMQNIGVQFLYQDARTEAHARRIFPPACWSCGRQGHLQHYCNWRGTEARLKENEDSKFHANKDGLLRMGTSKLLHVVCL